MSTKLGRARVPLPISLCVLLSLGLVFGLSLAAPPPSGGTMEWDDPFSMHHFYAGNLPVIGVAGSAPHRVGKRPGPQELHIAGAVYALEYAQMIGVREDGAILLFPTTGLDFKGWRPPTPAELDAVRQLTAGAELVTMLTDDRPRVFGALRNGPSCGGCHKQENGTLLGAMSYSLVPPAPDLPAYEDLAAELFHGQLVDADTLRWSFTRWQKYHPGGSYKQMQRRRLLESAEDIEWHHWVADHCERILEHTWIDIEIHRACAEAYNRIDQPERAEFHNAMFEGLLDALLGSGDGTAGSPYVPVTYAEIPDALAELNDAWPPPCETDYAEGESFVRCEVIRKEVKSTVWFQTTLLDEWVGIYGR